MDNNLLMKICHLSRKGILTFAEVLSLVTGLEAYGKDCTTKHGSSHGVNRQRGSPTASTAVCDGVPTLSQAVLVRKAYHCLSWIVNMEGYQPFLPPPNTDLNPQLICTRNQIIEAISWRLFNLNTVISDLKKKKKPLSMYTRSFLSQMSEWWEIMFIML